MEDIKTIKEEILKTGYKNPLNSPLWLYKIVPNDNGKVEFLFYCFLEDLSNIEKVNIHIDFKGRKKSQDFELTVFKRTEVTGGAYIIKSASELDSGCIEKIQNVEIKSARFSDSVHVYTPSDYKHFEQFRKHGWDYLVDNRSIETVEVAKPKRRLWLWILGVITVIVITVLFLVNVLFANDIYYYKALNSLNNGDYVQAITSFQELNDFKDSQELLKQAQYGLANEYMSTAEYQKAYQLYVALKDYKESETLKNKALYQYSVKLMEAGNYIQALDGFGNISGYEDVDDRVLSIHYLQANDLYAKGKYSEASTLYRTLVDKPVSSENKFFTTIEQTTSRKNYYLSLDKILETTSSLPFENFMTGLKTVYQGLSEFSEDPEIAKILISQRYWQVSLVGEWRTSNKLFQFNVSVSDTGAFSISHNLEGYNGALEMKVQEGAIYVKQQGSTDFTKWLTISFSDKNHISIVNEISKATIEMSK